MDSLPRELLIEIFDKLNTNQLLALTLVCHRFNDIISNCKRLMNRLVLRFRRASQDKRLVATRKYTRIQMHHSHCQNLLQFVEVCGESICDIRMMYVRMELWTLKALLRGCPNLRELALIHLQTEVTSADVCEPLPRLQLVSLNTNCDRRLFKLLMECTVKELTVFRVRNDRQELKVFQQFLKRQRNLQRLEFTNFREDWRLFETNDLDKVDFKLRELRLHNFETFDTRHFEKFLANHSETLERVTLRLYKQPLRSQAGILGEMLELFRDVKAVKCLALKGFDMTHMKPFQGVESLELEDYFKVEANLAKKFPNLRHLHLLHCRNINYIAAFTKLESLKISHYRIDNELLMPSVGSLRFKGVLFACSRPFDYGEAKVEKLSLLRCENVAWLVDLLKSDGSRLRNLRVMDSNVTSDDRKFIEDLGREKIGELMIAQGEGECGNDDDWALDTDSESEEEAEVEEESIDEEDSEGSDDEDEDELDMLMLDDAEDEIEIGGNRNKRPRME